MSQEYKNIFNPNRGQLVIPMYKDVEYLLKSFNLPTMNLNPIEIPNPILPFNEPSSQLDVQSVSVTFNIDEYLENYSAIQDWMEGIAPTMTREDYQTDEGLRRQDIAIILYDSAYNPFYRITLERAFPTSLSEIEVNFEEIVTEPRVATVEFAVDRIIRARIDQSS